MIDFKTQHPTLIVRPGPNDTNLNGSIFGGWLASQFDIAASITATQTAKGPTATVAIKELIFIKPIFTYDVVSFYNEVLAIGNTSVTIKTEAYAQRMNNLSKPDMDTSIKVAEATLVFVAINKPGEKRIIQK